MEKIDFVILWVDGSDPKWIKEKNKYLGIKDEEANSSKRWRDYDILKYLFRGIDKYIPWVNKVHLVTCGHLPKWIDVNCPKLNIVKHEDFIPKDYLPTFNSHTIELNIHRIEGLADKFVYFNDDMLVVDNIGEDYFFKEGLPTDSWQEDIIVLDKTTELNFSYILVNDLKMINSNFDKKVAIKKNFSKWFNLKYGKGLIKNLLLYNWSNIPGFCNNHMTNSYLKSTFEEVWKKENDVLHRTCITKFREDSDVNQYVMKLWQIYSGNFTPKAIKEYGRIFTLNDNDNSALYNFLNNPDRKIVCINDGDITDFDKMVKELHERFDQILGEKCSFEKRDDRS